MLVAAPAVEPRTRPPAPRRPLRNVWFASDLHLHADDPDGVVRACRFLVDARASGADAVLLLGDVFRAWLGPPSLADPGLAPFLDGLTRTVATGARVVLLHGNHDFLMGPELREALGVEVVRGWLDLDLQGLAVRALHGDALCTADVGYHRLHRVLRSGPVRWLLGQLPRRVLAGIAGALLHGANRTSGAKAPEIMGIVDAEAAAVLALGLDALVCGHVHQARDGRPGGPDGGRLLVMADFERSGSHARFLDGRLVLLPACGRYAREPGPVVAIDGPAGSGKSTVGKRLAARLGWVRLDSGALYRAVTAHLLEQGLAPDDPALADVMARLPVSVDDRGRVRVDGRVVPEAVLRSPAVSAAVSPVSAVPAVRRALLGVQRAAARVGTGLVAEGRDMATVVFPEADLAVWMDARLEVRAARRLAQNPGEGRTLDEVVAALSVRDRRDSTRPRAPLARAPWAVVLDTSELELEQVLERLEALVGRALEARSESGPRQGVAPAGARG